MDKPIYLFVYGTLMYAYKELNEYTKKFHEQNIFIKTSAVKGYLYQVDWYPGLVLDPNGLDIYGEIYQIKNTDTLLMLDTYEEATTDLSQKETHEYIREPIQIESYNCFIYLLTSVEPSYTRLEVTKFQPFV
jgi:gamma-glutamylcyclotransferase (GGCT)/AIG2-like uncharacterized protein YtfP